MSLLRESAEIAEQIEEFLDRVTESAFHDEEGKFAPATVARAVPGSFSRGGSQAKTAKKNGKVVQRITSVPCGRKARKAGGDVRCYDGAKKRPIKRK